MSYEAPILEGPAELYETPLLLDVQDLAGCNWGCVTSGSRDQVLQPAQQDSGG